MSDLKYFGVRRIFQFCCTNFKNNSVPIACGRLFSPQTFVLFFGSLISIFHLQNFRCYVGHIRSNDYSS